jgi:DNA-binding beta-propeller fold protein YncE
LVAVSGEQSLAVVDLLRFQLRDPIPLGAAPTAVVSAARGGGSYALTPSTGSVHLIDASLKRVGGRKLAQELSEIQLSPTGPLLAVSAQSREIIAADPHTLQPVHRIKVGARGPEGGAIAIDVSERGDIAVSAGPERTVSLFGVDGSQRTTAVAGEPGQLRFRRDGNLLIVTRPADRVLTMLSVPDLRVLAELPLAMEPRNLCFDPYGGQLFVTGPGMD